MPTILKYVYKATQCTDLKDTENAATEVRRLITIHGWTPGLRRRLVSIQSKETKLKKHAKAKI